MGTLKDFFMLGLNGLTLKDFYFLLFQLFAVLFCASVFKITTNYVSAKESQVVKQPFILYALAICVLTAVSRFNVAIAVLFIPVIYFMFKRISEEKPFIQMMHIASAVTAVVIGSGGIILAALFACFFIFVILFEKNR